MKNLTENPDLLLSVVKKLDNPVDLTPAVKEITDMNEQIGMLTRTADKYVMDSLS